MKFKIKTSLLLGAALILFSIIMVSSFRHKTRRTESMMEYMNNFFSEDSKNKGNSLNKPKPEGKYSGNHQKHHKKHNKNIKNSKNGKSHFRFKEKTSFNNYQIKKQDASSGNAGNFTTTPILQDWFMISSPVFTDTKKFPPVILSTGKKGSIKYDYHYFRINEAWEKEAEEEKGPSNKFFWFRLSGLNMYYSLTKSDINILDAISVTSISDVSQAEAVLIQTNTTYCFSVTDTDQNSWKVCALTQEIAKSWVCSIKKLLRQDDPTCHVEPQVNETIIERNITQPIIIIPVPSPFCNENWNYQQHGDDWNCECAEGKEQAPIDLPPVSEAIKSPVKPFFQYEEVSVMSKTSTLDGQMKENENIKIKFKDNSLKIFHEKFGKVVTMDGAIYYAQEIVIHTPAEHTIDGRRYDMELQIIHYGQSKGDIAKQLILSFVFDHR